MKIAILDIEINLNQRLRNEMKFFFNWKNDLYILTVLLVAGLFLWLGNRSIDSESPASIQGIGGSLSPQNRLVFQQLHYDLENMNRLLLAEPNRIVLRDETQQIKEYSFKYNSLWCNGKLLMTHVKTFHFEFRGQLDFLLTRAQRNLPDVESVGFAAQLGIKGKNVWTHCKVKLPDAWAYRTSKNESTPLAVMTPF